MVHRLEAMWWVGVSHVEEEWGVDLHLGRVGLAEWGVPGRTREQVGWGEAPPHWEPDTLTRGHPLPP